MILVFALIATLFGGPDCQVSCRAQYKARVEACKAIYGEARRECLADARAALNACRQSR